MCKDVTYESYQSKLWVEYKALMMERPQTKDL